MPPPENPTYGGKSGADLLRSKPREAPQEAAGGPQGDHQPDKAPSAVKSPQEAPAASQEPERIDETVPGGRYQAGDKIVNAHNEVLEDAPKPAKKK